MGVGRSVLLRRRRLGGSRRRAAMSRCAFWWRGPGGFEGEQRREEIEGVCTAAASGAMTARSLPKPLLSQWPSTILYIQIVSLHAPQSPFVPVAFSLAEALDGNGRPVRHESRSFLGFVPTIQAVHFLTSFLGPVELLLASNWKVGMPGHLRSVAVAICGLAAATSAEAQRIQTGVSTNASYDYVGA